VRVLDGLIGATLGALTAPVISDLRKGTGRFNLVQGFVGALFGIGPRSARLYSGFVVASYGQVAGFWSITAVGLLAVAILWLFFPETKGWVPPHAVDDSNFRSRQVSP
jgi:hypothetical protein